MSFLTRDPGTTFAFIVLFQPQSNEIESLKQRAEKPGKIVLPLVVASR